MAIAIKSTLKSYRIRFSNSPAGQFFRWWGEELIAAMPAQFRERMQYARRKLLMQAGPEDIALSIADSDAIQSLDTIPQDLDVHIQQQRVRELLNQHELLEVSRDLLLPESIVLRSRVSMPLAAEAGLRQALAYEMDRHTPFQADEVYFTWRVINRDRSAGQLHFELFATPRAPVEAHIERLKRLGLAPTGVDVAGEDGPLGINLLPEEMRFHLVNKQVRANWMTAGVTVLLLIIAMTQSIWLRENQLEKINEEIDKVRAEAMAVQQVRKQIEDAAEAATFLQAHKAENGYKLEMLAELTRILPQDTYLDRLTMNAGTTQMQGKSSSAQSLIELINDSPLFENASFRGPTRLDSRSGKEIFDLNANTARQGAG
jgi:general secretion pathway protein L